MILILTLIFIFSLLTVFSFFSVSSGPKWHYTSASNFTLPAKCAYLASDKDVYFVTPLVHDIQCDYGAYCYLVTSELGAMLSIN